MSLDYRKEHEQRKQKVLSLLDKAKEHFVKYENQDKVKSFETLYQNIEQGDFSIVVVGEFSAGKSTFLNALMHDKFLPSFSNETTATINYLKHKDKSESGNEVAIFYKDPTRKTDYTDATIENITEYVSTDSSLNVVEDIDRVELYLDSKFLKDGVMLVDSPGLNGVAEGHKEVTENQIERSHACIFMFSAEQPGRKTDFEFLTHLMSKVDTILLVLNKIDVIKGNEQTVEQVVETLKTNYHNYFPDQAMPEIWPIAAYPALVARSKKDLDYHGKVEHSKEEKAHYLVDSRIERFEDRVWKFLTQGEKAKQELLSPVDRMKKVFASRKQELNQLIDELENVTDTNELTIEIDRLETEITEISEKLQEKKRDISDEVKGMIRELKENLRSKTQELKRKYSEEIREWTDLDSIGNDIERFNKKITSNYHELVSASYNEFIDEFEDLVKERYREYSGDIEKALEETASASELNVTIDASFDTESLDVNFGLEDYRNKISEMESEIEKLEEEADKVWENKLHAESMLAKKEALKTEMEMLKRREESYMSVLGPRPSAMRYTEDVGTTRKRGGLLGGVGDFLFGEKFAVKTVVKIDDSEQRHYDEQITKIEDKMRTEEQELRSQISQIKDPALHPSQLKKLQEKLEKSERQKREELNKLHEEYKEEFQRKHASALRKIRLDLEDFIDSLQKQVEKDFYKKIKNQKNEITDIVIDIISKHLTNTISKKRETIKARKDQLESSVEEKQKLIDQYNKEIASIDQILQELVPVLTELDSVEVDNISYSH